MARHPRRRRGISVAAVIAAGCLGVPTIHSAASVSSVGGPAAARAAAVRLTDASPGNPSGAPLPDVAQPVDTSHPDVVIGTGTPASCTSAAVVAAVARGGVITFDCGPNPVRILMTETAKVVNTSPTVVIDGGGKVTLDGGDRRRILYMNACDPAQVWVTSHCQDQDQPHLTLQGLTFTRGNSTGETYEGGGGGAVFVRGGRLKVVESTFVANRCDLTGPDLGGGAIRALSQYHGLPVVIARSTFGGSADEGNACSNGGALASIDVSWQIYDSVFAGNRATGVGGWPTDPSLGGGGSGGAIFTDGTRYDVELVNTIVRDSEANAFGGGICMFSGDRSGHLRITDSVVQRNVTEGIETPGYPGVYFLGAGAPEVVRSTITP